MGQGLLIMFIVFAVIAAIHFISIKLLQIAEEKKIRIRYIFWYIYGTIFLLAGIVVMYEKEKVSFIPLIQSLVGLTIIILNLLKKIETKSK